MNSALDDTTVDDHQVIALLNRDVGLGQGAKQGAAWLGAARLVVQVVQFSVSLVTARLLFPSQFGVAALAVAVVLFASIFADLGVAASVVQAKRATEQLLNTAFWVSVGFGLALAAVVAVLAWPISLLYGQHDVLVLLLIASLNLGATRGAVQTALLERTFNFKRLALIETSATIVGVVAVPCAAAAGLGAPSLVLGPLLGTLALNAGLWRAVPWRPSGRPSRAAARSMWIYSRGLVGFNAINYWSRNIDTLLLGAAVSTAALGYYNRAYQLMLLPVQQMSVVLSRSLYPSLARMRDDPPRMGRAWLRGLHVAAAVAMPIAVTFATTAPALITILYGKRWAGVAPILELLALSAVPQILAASTGGVFRALNKNGVLFRLGVIGAVFNSLAIVIGLNWGTHGVATGLLISTWVLLPIVVSPLLKSLQLPAREFARMAVRTLVPAGCMALAQFGVRWAGHDTDTVAILAGQLAAGGVVYLVALWATNPALMKSLAGEIKKRAPQRATPTPRA